MTALAWCLIKQALGTLTYSFHFKHSLHLELHDVDTQPWKEYALSGQSTPDFRKYLFCSLHIFVHTSSKNLEFHNIHGAAIQCISLPQLSSKAL
jgi:hypothetical protein